MPQVASLNAEPFFVVPTRQIELELAAARERVEGDEPDFKLDIDMLLGGGRSAGAQPTHLTPVDGLTSPCGRRHWDRDR